MASCLVMISLMHKPLPIFIVYCWMNLDVLPQSRKTHLYFPTTIDVTPSQSKGVLFPSSSGIISLELHRPILTILRPEDSDPPSTPPNPRPYFKSRPRGWLIDVGYCWRLSSDHQDGCTHHDLWPSYFFILLWKSSPGEDFPRLPILVSFWYSCREYNSQSA